ncbi:MAG: hypothetical protein JJE48_08165 [Actinobacteria bacterium]|nr:hypothetical protein [Actinomycetota bacterium]
MVREDKDLEKDIQSIREKAQRLQEELEESEAIDVLEEAALEVERFGGELEDAGS